MDACPYRVFQPFLELNRALIDASTIIYMYRAGYFDKVARAVDLYSLPEILAETGHGDLHVKPIDWVATSGANDRKLVSCALGLRWPVISEDKKILLRLERVGIPYFNALMMLHFLLFRKSITLKDHSMHLRRLKQCAWYSRHVLEFGKNIYNAILCQEMR